MNECKLQEQLLGLVVHRVRHCWHARIIKLHQGTSWHGKCSRQLLSSCLWQLYSSVHGHTWYLLRASKAMAVSKYSLWCKIFQIERRKLYILLCLCFFLGIPGVRFGIWASCLCKGNDKYQLCSVKIVYGITNNILIRLLVPIDVIIIAPILISFRL